MIEGTLGPVFGAASLAAGLAQTPGELIAARVVQGAAAAVMTPQLLATLRTVFDAKERGQAFGLYGAILGFASAIGLLLGGVLTSADLFGWSWRSVFFVNVPIALVALALSARFVPETRERSARRPDWAGAALLTAALVAIVYPLLEGRSLGWPAELDPVGRSRAGRAGYNRAAHGGCQWPASTGTPRQAPPHLPPLWRGAGAARRSLSPPLLTCACELMTSQAAGALPRRRIGIQGGAPT